MLITPQLSGNIARNCHPIGCQQYLQQQAAYIAQQGKINGAKKVLILGASSGFGLASRLALSIAGGADTIGVSFERGPSERGIGSAGWYNNIYFRELAEKQGLTAKNFIGDAFSPQMRDQVINYIKQHFGGQVDLVIYSLATGKRTTPSGQWQSVLKTTDEPLHGFSINLETEQLEAQSVALANAAEVEATTKVMGGDEWRNWIDALQQAKVLAEGCNTIAYSYIGPERTAAVYRDGTIGRAKQHLHATATELDAQLTKHLNGHAYACVCKALVTKASVYIPVMSPYIALLYQVMKEQGNHEECIEQAYRLFSQHLYPVDGQVKLDKLRQIRIDDYELSPQVQQQIDQRYASISPANFKQLTDFAGYKSAFLRLNGFAVEGVDYQQNLDINALSKLQP
ncbi:trans-2-enoyl-CoA reductase family protein [Agarivorans sp. TSD2052]|uniref:enoyl-ACP reductase FabV n=1 Tax=Agarivorans sp. TSD2052 TaxID=2937286 RepID=UPI00200D2A49|nr:enoyl-ACP reductase FabV [Agarivorans sp. TSD2052]UPW18539.1 trans-2-enoyl-CoA reductase family protein [Agarivorans sp. TSD2052]